MTDKTDPKSKEVMDEFFGRAAPKDTPQPSNEELLIEGGTLRVRDGKGNIVEVKIPALG